MNYLVAIREETSEKEVRRGRECVGDKVIAWLDRARWQRPHRASLSDPALDPIRADPRFSDLAAQVGRAMGLDPANVSRFVSAHLAERHSSGR